MAFDISTNIDEKVIAPLQEMAGNIPPQSQKK
jgi:hypothetical protein